MTIMQKRLSIKEATKLYSLIGKYIPEDLDEDLLTFAGKIIDSIIDSDDTSAYADSVLLMTDATIEDLQSISANDMLNLFLEGLVDNEFLSMKMFFMQMGFSYD